MAGNIWKQRASGVNLSQSASSTLISADVGFFSVRPGTMAATESQRSALVVRRDLGVTREKILLENDNGMIYCHTGGEKNGSFEDCNYN